MAYSTKTMLDGPTKHVVHLYGQATDTTGENGVIKVDRSALTGPNGDTPDVLGICEITASVQGFESVKLYFEEAGGDEVAIYLAGESYFDFTDTGILYPTEAPADATDGDIKLSTYDGGTEGSAVAGDTYFIKLVVRKG